MTYRCKNLKIKPELPRIFFKNSTESRTDFMLANRVANVSFIFNAARAINEFHRNNVYGHLEQVSRTSVYFHFQITQLVLQTCSKCPYTLFMLKFNDSSLCISNKRYICTTICKHKISSGLCRIFGKVRGNSG